MSMTGLVDTRVERILPHIVGPEVLDIGCTAHDQEYESPLWLHGRIHKLFPDAVGIDIDQDRLAEMRSRGYRNVHLASAESFDLGQRFDTIMAGEVIEHLDNPGEFLDRCREHLKPGGRLVLSTPQPFAAATILYALSHYPDTCANWEHTTWFCPQTLRVLCGRHGFKTTHYEIIPDYRSEVPDLKYRTFVTALRLARPVLPKLLTHNAILSICVVA